MKKLIFLLLICFSCEKQEHDFAVTQIVNLKTANQIATNCEGFTLTLDRIFKDKDYDEIHAIVKELTFEKWVEPNDTIWILRHYTNSYNQVFNIFYIYEDSVFEKSYVKSVLPYYCPEN
jgi:hypothetical protein